MQDLTAKMKLMEAGGESPTEPVAPADHHLYCNVHVGKDALLGELVPKQSQIPSHMAQSSLVVK